MVARPIFPGVQRTLALPDEIYRNPRPASPVVVASGDWIAEARLRELIALSPTVRQMLEVIQSRSQTVILLRSSPGLFQAKGQLGRGTFLLSNGALAVALDFEPYQIDARQQLAMIAHELAHVIEVVCLLPLESLADLRKQLRRRAINQRWARGPVIIETRFAKEVYRVVYREVGARVDRDGQLRTLASRHRLTLPVAPD